MWFIRIQRARGVGIGRGGEWLCAMWSTGGGTRGFSSRPQTPTPFAVVAFARPSEDCPNLLDRVVRALPPDEPDFSPFENWSAIESEFQAHLDQQNAATLAARQRPAVFSEADPTPAPRAPAQAISEAEEAIARGVASPVKSKAQAAK